MGTERRRRNHHHHHQHQHRHQQQQQQQPQMTTATAAAAAATTTANSTSRDPDFQPLSWPYARAKLRYILQTYLDATPPSSSSTTTTTTRSRSKEPVLFKNSSAHWIIAWAIENNVDLHAGSLLLSVSLLILACFSLSTAKSDDPDDVDGTPNYYHSSSSSSVLNVNAQLYVYRGQVAAAVLLLVGSIGNFWIVRRSTFLRAHDTEHAKRREINKFLNVVRGLERQMTMMNQYDTGGIQQEQEHGQDWDLNPRNLPQNASETGPSDIYPVYRQLSQGRYLWIRLPSLLLVEGDIVALQIGDIAPADCSFVVNQYYTNNNNINKKGTPTSGDGAGAAVPVIIQAGEIVTLESMGETTSQVMAELPRGRTTLPEMSEKLLLLCNNMRIFCVQKAPIQDFIHQSPVLSPPSQVWRQTRSARTMLLVLTPIFLALTLGLILVRPKAIEQNDLSLSLPLPILAALGVTPLVAPMFGFFLEVMGTARILRTVHPHAVGSNHEMTTNNTRMMMTTTNGGGGAAATPAPATPVTPAASEHGKGTRSADTDAGLLLQYIWATSLTRLSLWSVTAFVRTLLGRLCQCIPILYQRCGRITTQRSSPSQEPQQQQQQQQQRLVPVPPASLNLLEKLGVCTAFALVDDELAYELNAIPQQLLIPSGHGLKLLDLCPVYDDEEGSADSSSNHGGGGIPNVRSRGPSFEDSDSESQDEEGEEQFHSTLRQKILKRRVLRRRKVVKAPAPRRGGGGGGGQRDEGGGNDVDDAVGENGMVEVQFEDPLWWQYLPALKSIGLSCMLMEDAKEKDLDRETLSSHHHQMTSNMKSAKEALVNLITVERRTHQLSALAYCIGFSREANSNGPRGDISSFEEQMRFQVISKPLFQERLSLDSHERSSEQSRWWGHLRADSTSVIVKDKRTGAYQLLTVGDPHIVANLCNEAWQGEISTILPLGQIDRQTIAETSRNWKLADLDVAAFGYAPVPHSLEKRLKEDKEQGDNDNNDGNGNGNGSPPQVFLLDASNNQNLQSVLKDKSASRDWALIRNQVFLGVLGSLVVPRREIPKLLGSLNDAGVRFVYFSPRNMRRQKELASQMGIDVAWNCAISLRPLQMGEEDPHRMVSTYADWDVNAKLPHGVAEVRKHLEEVDNVPLLVSLYTDTTKRRTKEMLEVFQEHHDTVLAIGIAHLPRNHGIFAAADIAVGIDVLGDNNAWYFDDNSLPSSIDNCSPADRVAMAELEFVSAIATHSCAFRFHGVGSLSHLSSFIEEGRAALEASISAGIFLLSGTLSFSFFVLFSACATSTTLPYVPTIGAAVYLQLLLPMVGLSMALTRGGKETMKQVPPKNDPSQTFGPKQGLLFYQMVLLKALMVAVPPQLLHLIAFGELVIHLEPELVETSCQGADRWFTVIRCEALREYSGPARISSGITVFAVFTMSSIVASASYVSRFAPIQEQLPWERNLAWLVAVIVAALITVIAAALATENGTAAALPWYFYIISISIPGLCIVWNEYCKAKEAKREIRAEKLRRLQFETRLGAWSPKN